jgi:outer membrane protein OmpA-like peptidoglycan-associated protein
MKNLLKYTLLLLLIIFGIHTIYSQKVNKTKKNISDVEQVKEEPVFANDQSSEDTIVKFEKKVKKFNSDEAFKLKTILYENETQVQISSQMKDYLNSVALFMKENPKSTVIIDTHSDNIDPKFVDDINSNERANNCLKYLISKQISRTRIFAKGNGDIKPVGDTKTDEGRRKNRRIEITVRP